jgi:hypothetical protein
MQKLPTPWLLLAALACGACETVPQTAPGDPFVGRWSCGETRTLTFTAPAGSPDATTKSFFVLNSNVVDGQLSLYATNEAGAPCRLNFTEKGTSATLMTGQSCMTLDGITLNYTMGTADIGATGLETNLTFDFAGTLQDVDAGTSPNAAGSGTISTVCSRIVASGSGATGGGGW